jgi:ATP-dependent DNA helicase RecG
LKRADKAEYPIKAIRKLVLNALIHRDYSIYTENSPIRIMMFPNRFEIENPRGLYGRITIDSLGKIGADTRNPYIASALEIMIDNENRFSGIPTIRNEMKKAGLKEPLFTSTREVFKASLLNEKAEPYDNKGNGNESYKSGDISRISDFCREPKTRDEMARFIGISSVSYMMNKYIIPLIKSDKLRMTLPDKPRSKNQRYITV